MCANTLLVLGDFELGAERWAATVSKPRWLAWSIGYPHACRNQQSQLGEPSHAPSKAAAGRGLLIHPKLPAHRTSRMKDAGLELLLVGVQSTIGQSRRDSFEASRAPRDTSSFKAPSPAVYSVPRTDWGLEVYRDCSGVFRADDVGGDCTIFTAPASIVT